MGVPIPVATSLKNTICLPLLGQYFGQFWERGRKAYRVSVCSIWLLIAASSRLAKLKKNDANRRQPLLDVASGV